MSKQIFEIGQTVKCIKTEPFPGKQVAPPLFKDSEYQIKGIILDKEGNQHLDVGLISQYNYITSIETEEELKDGDVIHWCHPSRFI